jgi:hypothetical protein
MIRTRDYKERKQGEAEPDVMQTPLTNFYSVHRDNRNPPKSLKTKIGGES